jgi:hypothetical protein
MIQYSTSWAIRPCSFPPARTFINIRRVLVVKIPTKITAIDSKSWLDVNFYIVRYDAQWDPFGPDLN